MYYDSDTIGEELVDRLLRKLERSSFDAGKEFWPHGCIEEILTPKTIADELAEHGEQAPPRGLVDFIDRESRRTFAIVLCCSLDGQKLIRAMRYFESLNFKDSDLPIVGDEFQRIFFSSTGKHRDPWNRLAVRSFNSYQWKSIAPVFNYGIRELKLESDDVFPFTWSSQRGTPGTFGEVHEVTIHPAHRSHVRLSRACAHSISTALANLFMIVNQTANVAIKKLHRAYTEDQAKMRDLEKEWQKEVKAHRDIAACNHSNIIKFITAISRDYERYLMFEWANGGNLREFWINDRPRLTKPMVKDILIQIRGLADALEEIHSKGFRHGDIKPENVLRVKTPGNDSAVGTLKICDMGLTKYHYFATQLREQATDT